MSLKGKRVLVTGASRGIGRAVTHRLLDRNASVIGTRRQSPFPKEFTQSNNFSGVSLDLSERDSLIRFLESLEESGWPDVVINNAGIFLEAGLDWPEDSWTDVWDKTLQVNLYAPALICKRAISNWIREERDGILINISSRAAYRGDTQEYAAYAASKSGLVGYTKSISRELGKKGVVAYSIAPGFVETDMAKDSISVYGEEYLKKDLSFNELTQPKEVAELVCFLSEGNVKHMTGTTFHINGGSYLI